MEKELRGRNRVVLGIGLALSGLILCAAPASAAPWWWVHFSKGDDVSENPSEVERWMGFAVNNAAVTDTVYVQSYTYDATGQDIISGLSGANGVGLNGVAALKAGANPNNYLIVDADQAATDISADADNTLVTEPADANEAHNKLIVIPGKYVITGSGNYTASAMSAQPNDFLQIRVPSVTARFVTQMDEFVAGTFHDNTASGGSMVFYSPQNDTIEVYFSPDENGTLATGDQDGLGDDGTGHLPTHAATGTVEGAIMNHIWKARESLFYSVAGFTLSDEFDSANLESHMDALTDAGKLVEGAWETLDNSPVNGMRDRLQLDHESRDGNAVFASPFHNKFMVIDQEVVITGSGNFTASAMAFNNGNDENKVVISDFRLARKYLWYYRNLLNTMVTTADGVGANTFEVTKPAGATGFTVVATDTAFYPSWTADATNDVTRYFIFIDTVVIDTKAIGDGVDEDADGNVDEDPKGNADNFSSGTTEGSATANDDDADGADDEDLWMWPEIQVKGRASTSGAIRSCNVGDSLLANTNYWFAIVSVDTHGNEAGIDTFGPLQLGAAVDTRLKVVKNSDIADTNARRGDTSFIAMNVFIRGDTVTADTLTLFAVKNLGLADSRDLTVRLWRDEDADSAIGPADTMVGQLVYSTTTGRYQANWVASDTRMRLGTAGKTFLVALDIFDTATLGDTFQARIDARTCSSPRRESGPTSVVANTGKVTIVSTNPVDVTLRGDYGSASVAKGASNQPVMTLMFSVATSNDTLQVLGVSNDGTMTSADITEIRIYHDGNSDSVIDAAPTDTLIGYMRNVSGAVWRADTCAYRFSGTTVPLVLSISVSGGATSGRTFQGRILANSADAINADTGPAADRVTTALFTVPSDTAADTSIVVNEFYTSPGSPTPDHDNDGNYNDPEEEYVELYNNSDGSVDVGGWGMNDAGSLVAFDVTLPAGLVLGPRQFLILYAETTVTSPEWFRYDSMGQTILESGTFSAGTFPGLNDGADSIYLRKTLAVYIDTSVTGGGGALTSSQRIPDGSTTWFITKNSPGINSDPSTFDTYSPNAIFSVTTDSNLPPQGVNFGLIMTMRTRANQTCSTFAGTAVISASTGTISPTTTGAFAAGLRQDSFMITGAVGICTISVRYNVTTVGYCTVNIQPGPPPDTKIVVTINSHLADTSSPRGTDTAIVLRFRVRGETVGAGDTLVNFVCENLGLADELDAYLELWRDNDNDSQWTTADSKVASLVRNGAFWSANGLSAAAAAYLGSGGSAGRNFMVIANTYDTATLNDTLQLKVNALSFDAVVGDSGPVSGFTNSGKLTIVSANQVVVTIRGDTPSETIPLDETRVAMQILLSVTAANDTITGFAVTNVGTMGNSDVAAIRLWHDHSADSILTAADTLIAVLPFASGLIWRNASISYPFSGASIPLLVTIQTAAGAAGLVTFRGQITAYEAGTQNGDSGPTASISTTATFTTPSDTVLDTFVVLNEFIVDPAAIDHDNDGKFGDGDEEYVELFNTGSGTVNVGGWKIEDDQTAGGDITLSPATIYLGPKQFLVVYADSDLQGRYWYRFASDGITIMDSGSYAGTWNQFNNTANGDSVHIRNSANALIDSSGWYTNFPSNRAYARRIDGVGALTDSMFPTPGKNLDPTATYNRASPNANLLLSAIPSAITEGDSLTLTMTMRDSNDSPVTTFSSVVSLTSDTGNVTPDTSGAFTAGLRSDSITVTAALATCSAVITSTYNTTTTGTTAITVYRRATITATINLEARGDESGCTGTLANGVDTYIAVSNASGTITFTNVKAGSYSLTTKENHHLRRVMPGIAVVGVDSTVTVGVHRAGDANNDNRVNIFDGGVVRFTMISGAGTPADIDGSGAVNNADLQWIRNNFGRAGD